MFPATKRAARICFERNFFPTSSSAPRFLSTLTRSVYLCILIKSYFSRSRSFRYTEAVRGRKKNSVIILGNETFPPVFHQGWIFLFRVLTRECTENSLCSAFLLCMIYSVNDCAVKSIKIAPRHKLLTLNYFAKNLPMGRPFQKIQRTWCKGNG